MAIQLSPEQEQVVGQAIDAGLIRIPDDVVEVGIETIRQRLEARDSARATLGSEEWSRELHTWIHGHSITSPVLTDEAISRESIYGTRGL
jgi:hypothetical protein